MIPSLLHRRAFSFLERLAMSWHLPKNFETSADFLSATGFVAVDVGDEYLDSQLVHRIFVIKEKLKAVKTSQQYAQHNRKLLFYKDMRAIVSGRVPKEQILQVRLRLFENIQKCLHEVSGEKAKQLSQLKHLIHQVMEGTCQEVVYAAVIARASASPNRSRSKLIVLYRSFEDEQGVSLAPVKAVPPNFARKWANILDVNVVKTSLTRRRWDHIKQWLLSDHLEVITTDVWRETYSVIFCDLASSLILRKELIDQLVQLTHSQDLDKSWDHRIKFEEAALTYCKFGEKICIRAGNEEDLCRIREINKELGKRLKSSVWIQMEQQVKSLLVDISSLIKSLNGPYQDGKTLIDSTLHNWTSETCFSNNLLSSRNFIPKTMTVQDGLPECNQQSGWSAIECSVLDDIKGYTDQPLTMQQLQLLQRFQHKLGEPATQVHPSNILLISHFGSHLYNLSMPSSDSDFVVIFRRTQDSDCCEGFCEETFEQHNKQEKLDFLMIESRRFCQALLRTSPPMLELIFCAGKGAEYVHPLMDILLKNWSILLSEQAVASFEGFALKMLQRVSLRLAEKSCNKHLYQAFHKILSLESLSRGERPLVQLQGSDREFFVQLRSLESMNNAQSMRLLAEAESRVCKAKNSRKVLFPEYPNHQLLQLWLQLVRKTSII